MASIRLENAARLYLESRLAGNVREAAEKYTGAVFQQHTTGVADGVEGFVRYYSEFINQYKNRDIRIIRAIDGKDFVFLHGYQNLNNGQLVRVTADFFKFDASGRVIEHWDVIGGYDGMTPSEHTSVDGPVKVEDEHMTDENKFIVTDMIQNVFMQGGDKSKLYSYFSDRELTQHNSQLADGIENLQPVVMARDFPLNYERIVLVAGQGNFVATLSDVVSHGQRFALVDIFRLKDRKIVEHWDVVEPVLQYDVNSGKF